MKKDSSGFPCESCFKIISSYQITQLYCGHIVCKPCIVTKVISQFYSTMSFNCIICNSGITEKFLRECLGDEHKTMLDSLSVYMMNQIGQHGIKVTCIKCQNAFLFEPGKESDAPRSNNGVVLKKPHTRHYANFRFRCMKCHEEQCRNCQSTPYHLGYTCEEFEKLSPCRYCGEALEHEIDTKSNPFSDICTINDDCMEKIGYACDKLLDCKHRCGGIKNENYHFDCLYQNCKNYDSDNFFN